MDSKHDLLAGRDALADHAHTATRLVGSRGSAADPVLTIAIPTYRRPDLLQQAVASALAQDANDAIEIIVVDNDPTADGAAVLELAPPANRELRYFVNAENIGMFGNWNKALEHARGRWFAMLNDDDLFDPQFARVMLSILRSSGGPNALICQKRVLDERTGQERRFRPRTKMQTVLHRAVFRGRRWRRIGARHLFWGNTIGNSVGLIGRTDDLRTLGGFDPENYPSADYYVHARLATRYVLGQAPHTLASIRVGQNESMKPETLYGFLRTGYDMQQALAGRYLPKWWARLSPPLIAWHIEELSRAWNVALDRGRVERELQISLPHPRERGIKLLRAALGGI